MSIVLRVSLLIGVTLYMVLLFTFLKNKSLSLKYSLVWIVAGIGMYFFALFPKALEFLVHILGIETHMNGLFSLIIFFVILIVMSITAIVSHHSRRIRKLTQAVALLEKRIRELENREKEGKKS